MQELQKSRRVSWALDANLCQTRLFLSEHSPAQIGLATQDHLQEKALWTFHSGEVGLDGILPPSFGSTRPVGVLKNVLTHIPVIKWNHPPRFMLDPHWHIVSGEESQEVDFQKQREMRVLEAIYPRPSAIPSNPVSIGAKVSFHSDQLTLVLPITPIEDEDTADPSYEEVLTNDGVTKSPVLPTAPTASSSQGTYITVAPANQMAASGSVSGMEPHLAATVAHATLTAVMSNKDQGNVIDPNLLLEILNNPQLIEQLVRMQGSSSEMQNLPGASITTPQVANTQDVPRTSGRNLDEQAPLPINKIEPARCYVSKLEPSTTSVTSASTSSLYPPRRIGALPSLRQPVANTSAPNSSVAPAQKDINYFRSLVQQHGGEKQASMPNFSSGSNLSVYSKSRDSETRNVKPCMFYNTSRGCRNGDNCPFEHVSTSQKRVNAVKHVQNNKRMKMDGGIYGT